MSETRKSALIAEDDAALRRMMVTLLRPFNLQIDEARDGLEAVERLREHPYDVVILDLMMPRVDGRDVIRYMEANHPRGATIVTSAARGEDLRDVARSKVVRDVINKPFDIAIFANRVHECLTLPLPPPSSSATADERDGPGATRPS